MITILGHFTDFGRIYSAFYNISKHLLNRFITLIHYMAKNKKCKIYKGDKLTNTLQLINKDVIKSNVFI